MVTGMQFTRGLPRLSESSLWLDSPLASRLKGVFLRNWMEKPAGYIQLRRPQPQLQAVMGT